MNKEKKEVKDENVVFRFCITITNKDYKIKLSTRRAWVIGVFMFLVRFLPKLLE